MSEKLKTYAVYIDCKNTLDQVINARSKKEAKEKAFEKIKKSMFKFKVEQEGVDF